MADVDFDIPEWWDHSGDHHEGQPSDDELLGEAGQVTVHVYDDDGNDFYFTSYSHDGWTEGEIAADVDDAYEHYA